MSNFTLDLGGADLSNAHFGNRNINASRTIVHGDRIDHNVAGDQVNTTGAARPGCGAQGVPDFTRPPVANDSKPPAAGTFNIKAQNAKMQGARFGDVSEDHSVSEVFGKDITHNVSGNQYNHDQPVAQRNADVPASVPASNAWQPPKEPSVPLGGGWYHWSLIPSAALAALDAGTGALASVVGRCCRALRVRLLAALAPAPHVCSSSPAALLHQACDVGRVEMHQHTNGW